MRASLLRNSSKIEPAEYSLLNAIYHGANDIIKFSTNEARSVEIIPGKVKTIFTHGLAECQAALALVKSKNGNLIALMSHYEPRLSKKNLDEFKRLKNQNRELIDFSTRPILIYSSPGEYINKQSGKGKMEIKDKELFNQFKNILNEDFPKGIETKLFPYDINKNIKGSNSSALIVNFPKTKGDLIKYQAFDTYFGAFGIL